MGGVYHSSVVRYFDVLSSRVVVCRMAFDSAAWIKCTDEVIKN
jgi:hypothetical protein